MHIYIYIYTYICTYIYIYIFIYQAIVCLSIVFLQCAAYKWKCPILSQFHDGYVINDWHFRYGQGRRQWEWRKWTVPPLKGAGDFPASHCWVLQKVIPLKNVRFFYLFTIVTGLFLSYIDTNSSHRHFTLTASLVWQFLPCSHPPVPGKDYTSSRFVELHGCCYGMLNENSHILVV